MTKMIISGRYSKKISIDTELDTRIITASRSMSAGHDIYLCTQGPIFYGVTWRANPWGDELGFYHIESKDAKRIIKIRWHEMTKEQQIIALGHFPDFIEPDNQSN